MTYLNLRLPFKKYSDPVKNKACKYFEVDNWVISKFIINEVIPLVGISPYPLVELQMLVAAVCWFKPRFIYEWGTNVGRSARIFYEIVKKFKLETAIYSIDLPDNVNHVEHPHKNRGRFIKGIKEIHLYQGDGITSSLTLIKQLKSKYKILFFLDGDHEYKSVKRELFLIGKIVSRAMIIIHDTFLQSKESDYNIGPSKAVQEFLRLSPKKYHVISTNLGLPGMTILIPKFYFSNKNR